jgi:VWFA-related protein
MRQSIRNVVSFFLLDIAVLAQAPTPPATTIRVPVRLVTASTLVFSKDGQLIPNLETRDFRVFDNDRLQKAALDTSLAPISVAIAVQANQDIRAYLPFIIKAGAVIETLLLGESGEAMILAYSDEVSVLKPFDTGDLQSTLRSISARGKQAHAIDAGSRAIGLLKERPTLGSRILIFIGQPMDSGSETSLSSLKEQAARENVTIFALALPEFGKAFVSDTFSLQGLPQDRGGFKAGVDLGKLISVLSRSSKAESATDPFSVLTSATGGTQLHVRRQKEFENAISSVGIQLRSAYLLSYSPSSTEIGYHTIKIHVAVPGAKVYTRPGYWLGAN